MKRAMVRALGKGDDNSFWGERVGTEVGKISRDLKKVMRSWSF
jgi:hypothetical protein